MTDAVAVIHGVGQAAIGAMTRDLVQTLGVEYTESRAFIDGAEYAVFTSPSGPPLIDVNWEDVGRPLAGVGGLVKAALDIAASQPAQSAKDILASNGLHRAYVVIVFWLFGWAQFPIYAVLGASAYADIGWTSVLIVLGSVAGPAFYWYIWRQTDPTSITYVALGWSLATAVALALATIHGPEPVLQAAMQIGTSIQILVPVILALIMVRMGWELRKRPATPFFTVLLGSMATYCIPVLVLSGLAAILTAIVLWAAGVGDDGMSVAKRLVYDLDEAAPYSIRDVELAMLVATGIPVIAAMVGWFVARGDPTRASTRGTQWLIVSIPLAMMLPLVVLGCSVTGGAAEFGWVPNWVPTEVASIYATSAIRFAPWLVLLLPPARALVDVCCDVAFYTTGATNLQICKSVESRLCGAAKLARSRGWVLTTVLAHSQGTVIAYDTLRLRGSPATHQGLNSIVRLVTFGSPLDSLYGRLFGRSVNALTGVRWTNYYRDHDYIGGEVSASNSNASLGPGSHTGYLTDWRVVAALKAQGII